MKLVIFLGFFLFYCCLNSEQQNTTIPLDSGNKSIATIRRNEDKLRRNFNNDTTIIELRSVGATLLDIRIDNSDSRELLIRMGKSIIGRIEIPTQENIQGFAINWIKEIENGFKISIEYGGSSRYYQKDFHFYYESEDFELRFIFTTTFDKQNPEDEKAYIEREEVLKRPVRFNDFKIEDYLY